MVVKMVSFSVVDSPVAPLYGSSSAEAESPNFTVPFTPSTVNTIGTRSTATTSPTSCARSAIGPPSFPVQTSSSACCCSSVASSSTKTTIRQLPSRMLPGMCPTQPNVRPVTSVPFTLPLSKCQAYRPSQVPPSGSSPTQQGHRMLHVQTSSRRPSSW